VKPHWPARRLGDICEFKYGKSLPSSQREPGLARVYGSNGPVGTHAECLVPGPAIVVGRKGSYGEVHFSEGPLWPIDTTYYVDGTSTDCDLRWLHYLLKYLPLTSLNRAAAVPGLNREDAYRLPILLPPLEEQRRIAAILDKADTLRRKRKRALELLDSLTQSIFVEMFGEESNLVELADICSRITDGTHQSPKWASEGIPFLFVSNVRNQRLSFETKKFVSESEYVRLTRHTPIDRGDVLYTAVGTYGNAAVVDVDKKFVFQRHIAHIKPLKCKIDPIYLALALEAPVVRGQADRDARGVAQKTVTLDCLKRFLVPLPPRDRQQLFVDRIKISRGATSSMSAAHFALDSSFTSLQHRAFSGQL